MSEDYLQAQLQARRWQEWGPHAIVCHNGPLTRRQRLRAAAITVGDKGGLATRTALELHGFSGFDDPADGRLHVVHPRMSTVPSMPDLVVHESRRLVPGDLVVRQGIRATDAARSAIDMCAWQPSPRFAYAVLAAVVQQRLTTARLLTERLDAAGAIRHVRHMRAAIADIGAGAQTLGEIDIARVCRRHGLAEPHRQRMRRDSSGRRRYLDCEWDCDDGTVLVLEVDGLHHLEAAHWVRDMQRERAFVRPDRRVLRCANVELRVDPTDLVADLIANGVPRRFRRGGGTGRSGTCWQRKPRRYTRRWLTGWRPCRGSR
ncbi:MAG: hypothetical protein M3474_08150 [Actinomycetota bacterium]|nr:hypothetical protein [Actinomycetota bacterium]